MFGTTSKHQRTTPRRAIYNCSSDHSVPQPTLDSETRHMFLTLAHPSMASNFLGNCCAGAFVSSSGEFPTGSWLGESVKALLSEDTKLKYVVITHSHWVRKRAINNAALRSRAVGVRTSSLADTPARRSTYAGSPYRRASRFGCSMMAAG